MQKFRAIRPDASLVTFGVAWLLLMAALVWMHARGSTQPPIYDALTYFIKAKSVWAEIAQGGFPDLLGAEPALRPPGTVLMAFPFGFDGSYPAFYFRSVFVPIVLVFTAVCVVTGPVARFRRDVLLVGLTASFLTTLSLFYYFEPYDGGPMLSYWGLVDSFQTGLAALAAASAIRSVRDRSIGWGFFATLVSIVMIYVKPGGTILAALLGALLTLGWLLNLRQTTQDSAERRKSLVALGVLVEGQLVLLGGAVLFAIRSRYLGAESMAFGAASIVVMRSEINLDFAQLMTVTRLGLGPFVPIWFITALLLIAYVRFRRRDRPAGSRGLGNFFLAMGAIAFFAGLWFWLIGSGGQTEIRYFTPFLYVAIICAVGPLLRALDEGPRPVRWFVSLLMLASVGNTVLLLALPDPALAWQAVSGVNVRSGFRPASIDQAQSVIDETAPGTKPVFVYSMGLDISDAMFETVFDLHAANTGQRRFFVQRPLDWQRPTMFRSDEIIATDYILFDPRRAAANVPLRAPDFPQEQRVFESWAKRLTAVDGIEIKSVQPASTLLRVVDRTKLRASLENLVATHRWRPIFADANPTTWWSEIQIADALSASPPELEDIHFEDRFEARAAMVERLSDDSTELRVWLRATEQDDLQDWILLVHYVDKDGKILAAPDQVLKSAISSTPKRPYLYVRKKLVPPVGTAYVAIGLYRGGVLMLADKGTRDWGGKRVLLSFPPSQEKH